MRVHAADRLVLGLETGAQVAGATGPLEDPSGTLGGDAPDKLELCVVIEGEPVDEVVQRHESRLEGGTVVRTVHNATATGRTTALPRPHAR